MERILVTLVEPARNIHKTKLQRNTAVTLEHKQSNVLFFIVRKSVSGFVCWFMRPDRDENMKRWHFKRKKKNSSLNFLCPLCFNGFIFDTTAVWSRDARGVVGTFWWKCFNLSPVIRGIVGISCVCLPGFSLVYIKRWEVRYTELIQRGRQTWFWLM